MIEKMPGSACRTRVTPLVSVKPGVLTSLNTPATMS
jgi:hypothetical protein